MPSSIAAYRERRFSAQDGLRLYARDYGDRLSAGRPMVCLTGLTRNTKDYHDLALRHAARRRVVCSDYRGRGRSAYDPDWRNYQPEVYVRDLMSMMAALGLHGIVVCGTSLGGLLAMGLAAATPAVLAGVILNDIGPDIHPGGLSRIMNYVGVDRPQEDWDGAIAYLKQLFGPAHFETEAKWRSFAEATYRQGEDRLLHYDWDTALAKPLLRAGGKTPDLWPLYRALGRIPVLALRGETSDVLSQATFDRMAEVKPDLIRVTVPKVGHTPSLDEPEAEQAIDTFLARLDEAQGN
ncbi:MAG: alpha/beta hydrolase [Rhodospirillales bacterium]|nr:alpha/beta hydrolase [Rhodospirillales bacterium]